VVGVVVVVVVVVVAVDSVVVVATGPVVVVVASPHADTISAAALITTKERRKFKMCLILRSLLCLSQLPRDESHSFHEQGLMAMAGPRQGRDDRQQRQEESCR